MPTGITLLHGGSTTTTTSYVTPSVTPLPNVAVYAWCYNTQTSGTPGVPTVSGCGLTWSTISTETFSATPQRRLSLLRGYNVSTASAGTIGFDFSASTQSEITVCLVHAPQSRTYPGTESEAESTITSTTGSASTSPSVSFGFGIPTAAGIGGFAWITTSFSPGSGYTEIFEGTNLMVEYIDPSQTLVDIGTGSAADVAIIAFLYRSWDIHPPASFAPVIIDSLDEVVPSGTISIHPTV